MTEKPRRLWLTYLSLAVIVPDVHLTQKGGESRDKGSISAASRRRAGRARCVCSVNRSSDRSGRAAERQGRTRQEGVLRCPPHTGLAERVARPCGETQLAPAGGRRVTQALAGCGGCAFARPAHLHRPH